MSNNENTVEKEVKLSLDDHIAIAKELMQVMEKHNLTNELSNKIWWFTRACMNNLE